MDKASLINHLQSRTDLAAAFERELKSGLDDGGPVGAGFERFSGYTAGAKPRRVLAR